MTLHLSFRTQISSSLERRRFSSGQVRWPIWRSSELISSALPALRSRRLCEDGCREFGTARSASLLSLCRDTAGVTWHAGECLSRRFRLNFTGMFFALLTAHVLSFSLRYAEMLRLTRAALICQKQYRMVGVRREYLRTRRAVITIQAFARGMFIRRLYQEVMYSTLSFVSKSCFFKAQF